MLPNPFIDSYHNSEFDSSTKTLFKSVFSIIPFNKEVLMNFSFGKSLKCSRCFPIVLLLLLLLFNDIFIFFFKLLFKFNYIFIVNLYYYLQNKNRITIIIKYNKFFKLIF